jgi:glucose-6-phosphate 1-epimerase
MDTLRIQHDGDSAEFSLFGGQLLRWQAGGRERLFLSPRAVLDGSAAIRGGVPVIFPQFNARGPFARHGFARTQRWQLREQEADRLLLELTDSDATQALWPHRFALRLRARIERDALTLALEVESLDARAFEFSCALHSYFACGPTATHVFGLQGCVYEEDGSLRAASSTIPLQPAPPLDRIYKGPASPLQIECGDDTLALETAGFRDWVMWNPGASAAEAMPDLGAEAAESFLCIEPGCIFAPIRLESGEHWTGELQMRVADKSRESEGPHPTTTRDAFARSKPRPRFA